MLWTCDLMVRFFQRGVGNSAAHVADSGEKTLATLSQDLTAAFGKGCSDAVLTRTARLADAFPDADVVGTLAQTLSGSHFAALLPLDKPTRRKPDGLRASSGFRRLYEMPMKEGDHLGVECRVKGHAVEAGAITAGVWHGVLHGR